MTTDDLNLNLTLIKRKIRWGQEQNNPMLIKLWLDLEEQQIIEQSETELKRQQYEAQFHLLLKTIEDELIANVWRQVCLDNIYQPLRSLHQLTDSISSTNQLKILSGRLAIASNGNFNL